MLYNSVALGSAQPGSPSSSFPVVLPSPQEELFMSSRLYSAPFLNSDIETTIRNQTQDFCLAFNTGNYDQAALLFSADGVLMSSNHVPVQTTKLIERALQRMAEVGYQDLRLETTRVENSGDMAMEIGRYRLTVHGPDGPTRADEGKYLTSWRRMGAWRILATCWSSNQPLPSTRQSAA
jgi:ketosteroid isomerase-like protein